MEGSDAFILSQVAYYRNHLGGGSYHSRNLIHGLMNRYEQEARKRGLTIL